MDTAVCDAPLVVTVIEADDDWPVPRLTVVLTGDGWSAEGVTDRHGVVRFERPPARWSLTVPPTSRTGSVSVEGGSCAIPAYVVRMEGPMEPIEDFSKAPAVRAEDTGRVSWHSQELLRKLPGARTLDTVLLLAPGVVPTRDGLRVGGAPLSEVEWRIDGVRVSDPVTGGWGPEVIWPMGASRPPFPGAPPPRR